MFYIFFHINKFSFLADIFRDRTKDPVPGVVSGVPGLGVVNGILPGSVDWRFSVSGSYIQDRTIDPVLV
jgi:hypothetical protein